MFNKRSLRFKLKNVYEAQNYEIKRKTKCSGILKQNKSSPQKSQVNVFILCAAYGIPIGKVLNGQEFSNFAHVIT